MDQFSTQYMPSSAGLIRAMPAIQKSLGTGGWQVSLAFFLTGLVAFFLAGLADVLVPGVWPDYPRALTLAIGGIIFGAVTLAVLLPWLHRRTARRLDQLLPPTQTRLAADDTGVTIRDDLSHAHWHWRHVHGARATPGGVALLVGFGGLFIPTAAFTDAGEQKSFIELVNRRADRSGI